MSSKFNYLYLECGNSCWDVKKIIFNVKNSQDSFRTCEPARPTNLGLGPIFAYPMGLGQVWVQDQKKLNESGSTPDGPNPLPSLVQS